jgi:hypothetical protein
MVLRCYSISSFVQRSGDGDTESLLDLIPLRRCIYFCYVLLVVFRLHVDCNRSSLQFKSMKYGSFANILLYYSSNFTAMIKCF